MIPGGVDDAKVRNQLLDEFNIEIAGGIGAAERQDLARRLDGLLQPEGERSAVPGGDGKSAAGSGLPRADAARASQPRFGATQAGDGERQSADSEIETWKFEERKGAMRDDMSSTANTGAMSQFVGAFEVTSKLTGQALSVPLLAHVERHRHAARGHHRHQVFRGRRRAGRRAWRTRRS